MLRCTDGLDREEVVAQLRDYFIASPCGELRKSINDELVNDVDRGKYVCVTCKGKYYLKHRIIWAIFNGPFYSHLDHIDRNPRNNALSNLRLCCQGLNVANSSIRSDNTTGYIGVIWHKASNKWQAQTMLKGKRVHIGLFTDIKEAALAYNHKLTELFGHQCTFNKVFEDHPDALTEE